MYSNSLKLTFLKINQIQLIFEQFERFLKFKIVLFHVLTNLWHLWLNYHTFFAVLALFRNRWDIVEKTCGFGSQYITVWNQVVLQLYFSTCLIIDIWELKFENKYVPVKMNVKRIMPFCFISFVFPVSFVVAINFWTYYSIEREIIDENNVMALYIPDWINHGLHTTIIPLVLFENILVKHSYPSKSSTFLGVCSILVSYAATCTVLYAWSGLWPYPLIRGMSNLGKISFVILNCFLGIFFVAVGEALNSTFWGIKAPGMITEEGKKAEKVS